MKYEVTQNFVFVISDKKQKYIEVKKNAKVRTSYFKLRLNLAILPLGDTTKLGHSQKNDPTEGW